MTTYQNTMKFSIIKLILLYICVFALFYVEPVVLFGVKIAVIWKICFLILISPIILKYIFKEKKIDLFILFVVLLSLKMFFNLSSLEYINTTISIVVKNLMLPLMFLYFIIRLNERRLLFLAKHFSIFTVLSFVPFLLNLVKPLTIGYKLDSFGVENTFGLVGTFMGPHSASESLGIVLIVLYYFFQVETVKYKKYFYAVLLLLGAYEAILTYARSGLVIAIIGIAYLWFKEPGKKKFITFLLLILPMTFGAMYVYQTNEVFKMRINDENVYKKQELGSGRLSIASNAINNWSHDGPEAIFIGLGYDYGLEKMYKSIGNKIFAHNKFVQMLQQEGLIGFILFLLFLYYLFKYIYYYRRNTYYVITLSLFLGYIVEMLLQGNFLFHITFLLSIFLALLKVKRDSTRGLEYQPEKLL